MSTAWALAPERTATVSPKPSTRLLALDRAVLVALRTRAHTPALETAARLYSRSGEHAACWLALGAGGWLADRGDVVRRRRWARGLAVIAGSYGANFAVKLAVRRRRPALEGLPPLSGVVSSLSFPSAHATTSFAAAHAYAGLLPAPALYLAAAAFALTRPYLGVHYPSDVLGGAALGTAVAALWPQVASRR
jgi:membrane-associated phospholipid phosphatase